MIKFEQHTLANGLKVIVHEDTNTAMAAVNVLYKVGSRDEDENQTGFAHLFEHFMSSTAHCNMPAEKIMHLPQLTSLTTMTFFRPTISRQLFG